LLTPTFEVILAYTSCGKSINCLCSSGYIGAYGFTNKVFFSEDFTRYSRGIVYSHGNGFFAYCRPMPDENQTIHEAEHGDLKG
jgi:hypothetical protein